MTSMIERELAFDLADRRLARPVVSFSEARELAAVHGTPLLAISREAVRRNYRAIKSALPHVELFYAAKANPAGPILQTLCDEGSSVDICSHGEFQAAVDAGFTPERMIHTHPCKTVSNLTRCYEEGVRWFTFDNANEVPKLKRYAPEANLLLRTAVASRSSVINLSAKFGASEADAVGLMSYASEMGLAVRGMSFHVGSQCREPDDYLHALRQIRRIWDRATEAGMALEVLDFGGGLPAPYRESVLTLEAYCRSLSAALDETFGDLPSVRIIGEPGRGICADTATLITSVLGKSIRNGMIWYIIDDGLYGSFSGQVYDHTEFPLLVEGGEDRPLLPSVVAGPTCDSTDVVSRDQMLPELEIGELIVVPTMGAYTNASASTFNGLDLAKVVGVK